jgi:hypothetical protein
MDSLNFGSKPTYISLVLTSFYFGSKCPFYLNHNVSPMVSMIPARPGLMDTAIPAKAGIQWRRGTWPAIRHPPAAGLAIRPFHCEFGIMV